MKIKNVMFTNKEVIEKPILIRYREKGYFEIICLLTIISIIASLYTFYNVGYIPLFKLLSGGGNHNFGVERINITRKFAGNQYIRNFLSLGLMPFLSLISYIYMRKSKNKKWLILFSIQFIFCILIKTYNFEKAPVIIYLFNFYIIEILMNTIKSIKKFLPYVLIGTILILFFYMRIFGYDGDLFSLSEGPISRIIISQVGTLCFHFDVFPNKVSFLHGASFPHWMGYLFGQGDWGQRSGAVVMEIYGGASVASGTAGVMSTTFIGEAYANWGLVGVIFSPIIFGSVFGLVQNFIYKQVKTPINMAFYTILLFSFTSLTVGGFIDIIYNVSIMFTVIIYVIIEFYARGFVEVVNRYGRKTKIRI